MLTLRKGQTELLEEALLPSFIRSLASEVRGLDLEEVRGLQDGPLHRQVGRALAVARRLGLVTRDGMRIFTLMTFHAGVGFHEDPEIAAILSDLETSEAARFQAVYRYLYGAPASPARPGGEAP